MHHGERRHSGTTARDRTDSEASRGRSAEKPSELPKAGWRDILVRTKNEISNDNISIVSAGVAFYFMFGLIPGLAALISIYGLVADPAQVQSQFENVSEVMPAEAATIIEGQMVRIASENNAAGWGVAVGILLALWGASKAVKSLIIGLNIAYDEHESRSFIKLTAVSLSITLGVIAGLLIAVGLIVAIPVILSTVGLGSAAETALNWLRWPALLLLATLGISALYRFAPCRAEARWSWISWGAASATILWIAGSALFSFYVSNFGNYNKTYGSLGAVAILLMWLYLTAFAILAGAELNSEMERQTRADTTRGPDQPLGQRGAYSADTIGESP